MVSRHRPQLTRPNRLLGSRFALEPKARERCLTEAPGMHGGSTNKILGLGGYGGRRRDWNPLVCRNRRPAPAHNTGTSASGTPYSQVPARHRMMSVSGQERPMDAGFNLLRLAAVSLLRMNTTGAQRARVFDAESFKR